MTASKMVVPNGGWGWMVVLGVALTNMFNQSLISLFGLIFGEKLEQMGHGTSGIALVMNICSVITSFSGLITGPAIKRFSPRSIAMAGAALSGSGMILSSFATSMWQIIITYSVFAGLGLGLIMPSTFVAVNSYFSTRRGRAVGIAMAGTGLGQMLMPQVVRYLLDGYGFQGTALILGALGLNGVVGAALFHPVRWHMRPMDIEVAESQKLLKENQTNNNGSIPRKPTRNASRVSLDDENGANMICESKERIKFNNIKTIDVDKAIEKEKPNCWQRFVKFMDLELLHDPTFISIAIGLSLAYTASIFFSMLYPFFLQESALLTRGQTAMCMSVLAGADIISRLTLPTITYKLNISCRTTFLIGSVLLAIMRSVLAQQTDYISLLVVSAFCGYVRAATVVNQNLALSEYCSEDKLPAALGLNMVMKGVFVMTLGQLLGWVRDYTDSFVVCIYAQSAVLAVIVVMWGPEMIYKKLRNKPCCLNSN